MRDAFLRYFHEGLAQPVPVAVAAQPDPQDSSSIRLDDTEILSTVRERALELKRRLGDAYPFYVCSEMGLHSLDLDDKRLHFVRSWAVVCGPSGEACGGSGSLQLPEELIEGLDREHLPFVIPGTRRRGGMSSSLTGGLETQRRAVALATLHALSSLLYSVLECRPARRRP